MNEPLVAEINLTGFKGMDPGLLKASLADAKDFVRAGIDRPYFLTYLVFEILNYENQLLIVVRTSKPVQVPYLEFLVELSWPDGNLIKDYTVLLDPPPPNLSKETRPKSLSQIAALSSSKNFGPDAIQVQLDKQKAEQQRIAATEDLSGIVKLAPNSFSDNTFDSDLPQKDTSLVPSEVPDIDEAELEAQAAKAAQQAATEVAYQKQLAGFKQEEQQKAAATAKQKSATILGKIVDKLEDLDSVSAINAPIVSGPQPHSETTLQSATAEAHTEEPIDFQHVLPPVPPPAAISPVSAANTRPIEPVAVSQPTFQPPTDNKTVPATSNHLYLGIILSLLLIAAGVAVAVKKMRDAKAQQSHNPELFATSSSDDTTTAVSEEFSMHDESMHDVLPDEPEEIELTGTIDSVLASDEGGQSKFDRQFDKIDLNELATPVIDEDSITSKSSITAAVPTTSKYPETSVSSPPLGQADLDNTSHIDTDETITIEPPTMFKTSGLTLEPEGATLIKPLTSTVDNSEAVQVKLDLAKEYLDTGDTESAKELLHEIIEIANDSQRLEAQMILSGII